MKTQIGQTEKKSCSRSAVPARNKIKMKIPMIWIGKPQGHIEIVCSSKCFILQIGTKYNF